MNQTERRIVVAFPYESAEENLHFQGVTLRAVQETMAILIAHPEKRHSAEIADIRQYQPMLSTILGNQDNSPYSQYMAVYFLNDAALTMCADIGLTLPIIGETTEQMNQYGTYIRSEYLPISQR